MLMKGPETQSKNSFPNYLHFSCISQVLILKLIIPWSNTQDEVQLSLGYIHLSTNHRALAQKTDVMLEISFIIDPSTSLVFTV